MHRKPCESRGSRTVLGARGGEILPRDSSGAVIRLLRVATALTNTRLILQLQLMTMCAVVGWWCSGDERGVQAGATVPLALGGLGQFSSITRRARAEDISSTSLTARRSRLVHGSWIYWARLDRTASFGNWRHWRTRRTRRRPAQLALPHLIMPAHHDVRASDVVSRRLHGALAAAAAQGPKDISRAKEGNRHASSRIEASIRLSLSCPINLRRDHDGLKDTLALYDAVQVGGVVIGDI